MTKVTVKLPPKLIPVFLGDARYRGAFGGRGSGKSFSFAKMLAVRGKMKPIRILCARELQSSIKESVHNEIVAAISSEPWLDDSYEYGESFIRGTNGTEFIFKGLRHNYKEIKSTADVDICWVEEAEAVSEKSWRTLIPTIRNKGPEVWLTWNPEDKDTPTNRRFRKNVPPRSKIVELNYKDNPWFPDELEAERLHDQQYNIEMYSHIWEGQYLEITEAQIFRDHYDVKDFEIDHEFGFPLLGMDFGFAQDPTTCVECYIKDDILYIRRDCGRVGLDLDDTPNYIIERMPMASDFVIRADSARPESISYLSRHGLPMMESVKKWPGSIADGISFIRAFKRVIIHTDACGCADEFRKYQYKVDSRTGDIVPVPLDKDNHYIDAVRYALANMIRNGKSTNYEDLL